MNKIKTGELIRDARSRKGYTQAELGELLGVSNKAVSRWETGESFPDVGVIENLASILDLKIKDIVTGESENDDEEETLKEVIRVVKLQSGIKKNMVTGVIIAVVLILLQILYWYGAIMWLRWIKIAAAGTFIALIVFSSGREFRFLSADKAGKIMGIISAATFVYMLARFYITVGRAAAQSLPKWMPPYRVGQFLTVRLTAVQIINLIILVLYYVRSLVNEREVTAGMFAAAAVMSAAFGLRQYLYNMTEVMIYPKLIEAPLFAVSAGVISVIFVLFIRRIRKK